MKMRRDEGLMLNVFTGVSNIFHNRIIREWRKIIFFAKGQNLSFSSFSLTSRSFCFEHEVQLRSLDYFDHFARCTHFTLHKKKINEGR